MDGDQDLRMNYVDSEDKDMYFVLLNDTLVL